MIRTLNKDEKSIGATLFIVTTLFLCAVAVSGFLTDTFIRDLDGDTVYAFPVYGQDSPAFVALAERLTEGGGFVNEHGTSETFRTPGYPFFLALSLFLSNSLWIAILLQIVFAAGIVALTFFMGTHLSGIRAGIVGAILVALSPNLIFHSVVALSDIVATFLVLLSVCILFFNPPRTRTVLEAGILLGIAALVRPVVLYLPIVLVPFLAYTLWKGGGWKIVLKYSLVFLVGFVVLVGPWYARNYVETGHAGFTSITLYNLASYNIPQFLSHAYGEDSPEYREYREKFDVIGTARAKSFEGREEVKKLALPILSQNLWSYGMYHLLETSKFFLSSSVRYVILHIQIPPIQTFFGLTADAPDLLSSVRGGDWGSIFSALKAQSFITMDRAWILVLTVLAFGSLIISRMRFYVVLLVVLIGYFAVLTGPVSIPRYRLPVEPFLVVLAVHSAMLLWQYRLHVVRFLRMDKKSAV